MDSSIKHPERRPFRPVFIGGCSRSGTTLLGALLGAHSRCICVPEMPFKFDLLTRLNWSSGVDWDELARLLKPMGKFRQWGISARQVADVGKEEASDYPRTIDHIVALYVDRVGKADVDHWVDHSPENIKNLNGLLAQFPDARFVHIIRDGRAVAASLLKLGWGPNTVPAVARHWAQALGYGLAAELRHPDLVKRVRYEQLVRQPAAVLREICGFLGLQYEEQLGRRTEFAIPRATFSQHRLVATRPDPDRAIAWRKTLKPREIELFESYAGDLLVSLGYERLFDPARPPSKTDRLQAFAADVLFQLRFYIIAAKNRLKHRLQIGSPEAPPIPASERRK